MHWPELHALFSSSLTNTTPESRRQNVINNPHITDWFFTQRLEIFIKHWLYSSLDAEWHWYRFEYQARGSIHCHGVATLVNKVYQRECNKIVSKPKSSRFKPRAKSV